MPIALGYTEQKSLMGDVRNSYHSPSISSGSIAQTKDTRTINVAAIPTDTPIM
jgi:hypothetical protein